MCSRLTNPDELDANAREFDADVDPGAVWTPSYNIAPTRPVVALGRRGDGRAVRTLRWGLVASWARDREMAARCILARAETVGERPAFRDAFARRRCAVLATGWYEWKAEGGVKRPHWFHAARGGRLALAALWERWVDPATGEELRTCAVVTCAPNALAAAVHDRMPVVLARGDLDAWMAPATPPARLRAMLRACPDDALAVYEVSRRVGNPREDDADLIARAA